jgi:serine protease AprX
VGGRAAPGDGQILSVWNRILEAKRIMSAQGRAGVLSILVSAFIGLSPMAAAGDQPMPDSRYLLTLGEQTFDPLALVPAVPAELGAVRDVGPDLHLVQFIGPTRQEWLDALQARGLRPIQYIYPYTYIVWGDKVQREAAMREAAVRWAGPFLPAYRLLPRYRGLDSTGLAVHALVVRFAGVEAVLADIAALGAQVGQRHVLDERFEVVGLEPDGVPLEMIACVPGVYSVQPVPTDGGLRGEMSCQVNANNIDQNNQAFPGYPTWLAGLGLSGAGVIIANVDSGIQNNHPDLVNRLISCSGSTCGGATSSSHGTHTAGIMAADGSSGVRDSYGFLRGLGVAPGASLVEQLYSPWYSQPGGMLFLMTESYRNGASLSGNSWGPSGTPRGYDNHTMQVDIGVRDADPDAPGNQPLTFVLSIMNGNGGTSTQGTPDEAKNIFTIGSTKMQTSSGAQILAIDDLSSNTAHGPCLDGRKIPHMVAPGCYVDSTTTTSTHTLMCGTSMASPHVSGAVALFIQYYRSRPEYTVDPSPALIKAAFIAVAHDLAGHLDADGGVLGHPFDSKQGWGRMDLEAVIDPQLPVCYFDNPAIFDNTGEQWVQNVAAADPNQPLRVMLVWTDAPGHGLGGSTPAWNNNLDLVVFDGVNTYFGNNFGAQGWSVPGGTADDRNNTEGVFIGPAAPGAYTIRVVAADINSDGVPNYGDATDQDFALVCYNCALEPAFTLTVTPTAAAVCAPQDAHYEIEVGQIMGFNDPVILSISGDLDGMSAQFVPNPVIPPGTSLLTISNTGQAGAGTYSFRVEGTSASVSRWANASVRVDQSMPAAPALNSPPDGATQVPLRPVLSWMAASGAASYTVEVALDPQFSNLVFAANLSDTFYAVPSDLAAGRVYYWRVRGHNACDQGPDSPTWRFTTRYLPAIMLVDDDDNNPDVRSYYADVLAALGQDYDLWDTNNSDNEPSAATLAPYAVVIWFTGDEWGGAAGPGAAGEQALADFLNHGKNLFITSQDYYYDRGLTNFMRNYLGVASATNDVGQTTVTGAGSVFSGIGPYSLSYPFSNFSDRLTPDATAEVAFAGNAGNAAVDKSTPLYRTVFFGFPFEAISGSTNRNTVLSRLLQWFRPFADCNGNGYADHVDIYNGTSPDANGNGVPDECEYTVGDLNCDGAVNAFDIDPFVLALTDPQGYQAAYPGCFIELADANGDGVVNGFDVDAFVELIVGAGD